ncbi:hypothetical protein [Lysinibacillus sp. OL1]|uniref:hypothetical protein n=1 Tax=Lysinibacillus sp. OL1 TaxID=2517243 RepID=UPI00103BADB0|nr:hypothetical protein [Lysinibacillus sp. OL1]TBV85406.1 hypothetical protein EW028_20860 [Lysinibacillus sp. OL1]
MGIIDFVILSITGIVFTTTLLLLIFSLKSTKEEVKRKRYKRTYVPVITLCVIVITLYVAVLSIGNATVNLMNQ